ncbi:MAG: hypothetical protein AAFN30_08265, partial [Actinomycetota bacterium]
GATAAEIDCPQPGEDLIERPGFSATRSITLGTRPDVVFDWVAQLGTGRAGWYSYDLIDNFGRRSATTINPAWLVDGVGDEVPAGPTAFSVTHLRRPDHLVLAVDRVGVPGVRVDFSLAYVLGEVDGGTRLVSRARAAVAGPLRRPLTWALGVGDGIMVRRQLLGLADRCR